MTLISLPIDRELPAILDILRRQNNLVVIASPGAGKTTRIAPALVKSDFIAGKVLLLQPRRIAARLAAGRIAEEQKWSLGRDVGYHVRFDRNVTSETRLEIITEGILTRRLQHDPFLEGVDVVMLDEFHERSIHTDLAIALLKNLQQEARPELRIVVMSATLDAEPVCRYLDPCALIFVEGKQYPLHIDYADSALKPAELVATVVAAITRLLREEPQGDMLAFLPGSGEIRSVERKLAHLNQVEICPLYAALTKEEQDRALHPSSRRKIILATNIAETSLTIDGVRFVIDSGYARVLTHDWRYGIDRLELTRISRASADQRAGRAARLGPGRVLRLWHRGEQAALAKETPAEIQRIDLASTILEIRAWGCNPRDFDWYEPPDRRRSEHAEHLLIELGALDDLTRTVTSLGKEMLPLPVHPRLARMLLEARTVGCFKTACTMAALLSERDMLLPSPTRKLAVGLLPDQRSDLLWRLSLLEEAEATRFRASKTSDEWEIHEGAARHIVKVRDELLSRTSQIWKDSNGKTVSDDKTLNDKTLNDEDSLLKLLLSAYPDRVIRRRDPVSGSISDRGVMVGGRGIKLHAESIVRKAPLFLGIMVEGSGIESTVHWASEIKPEWLSTRETEEIEFDETRGEACARRRTMYRDLILKEATRSLPLEEASTQLAKAISQKPEWLTPSDATQRWLNRLHLAQRTFPEQQFPTVTMNDALPFAPEFCEGKRNVKELEALDLVPWLSTQLTYPQQKFLDDYFPERIALPNGRSAKLHYESNGNVVLSTRLQDCFGWKETPRIGQGRVRLTLELLAPNHRPVQITQDLASFWRSTYAEVRKELFRRYPKHKWPENP